MRKLKKALLTTDRKHPTDTRNWRLAYYLHIASQHFIDFLFAERLETVGIVNDHIHLSRADERTVQKGLVE
jgi:hypothetical protein